MLRRGDARGLPVEAVSERSAVTQVSDAACPATTMRAIIVTADDGACRPLTGPSPDEPRKNA